MHPLASEQTVPNLVRASAVVACLCALACGDEERGRDRRDAGAAPDAMADPDAGRPSTRVAIATVQLEPVPGAEVGDAGPVVGTATFRTTAIGVDLEVSFGGCTGMGAHPLEILDAGDCSEQSLRAPVWNEDRGGGIPGVLCTGAQSGSGLLAYARTSQSAAPWTIGGPEDSNLIGRIVVVRDPRTAAPRACGVIARGEDAQRVRLPAPDIAPREEVLATLTGLCQFRQFTNAGPTCPDPSALIECGDLHCDLGRCAQKCRDYTACLDGASDDVCSAVLSCSQSAECTECQNDAMNCMVGFCPEHINCSPPLTPDGPCGQLESCCALQGENAETCLMTVQTIITFGGDANCIGSMNDWDFVAHQHVPCRFAHAGRFEARARSLETASGRAAKPHLAALAAGRECSDDDECPGGACRAIERADGTQAELRYCTAACDTASQCGEGGSCAAVLGASDERECLASCMLDGDCREDFLCTGAARAGRLSTPGACRPKRAVDQLDPDLAGRACSVDADCTDGRCASADLLGTPYPGNYCTGRCYEDAQCGEGGVCLRPRGSIDSGHCLERCAEQADCERDGYRCWELGDGTRLLHACYPGSPPLQTTGDACDDAAACGAPPARCARELPFAGLATNELTAAPRGYCTQACALDAECGRDASCINYGTSGGTCLVGCTDDAPCRSGYECIAHLRDGDPSAKVCVPETPGFGRSDADADADGGV